MTGLVLFDTGSHFTVFGQFVIATLIQIGGLGLTTFAVLFFSALGLPVGMPHKTFLREDLNQTSVASIIVLVRIILVGGIGFVVIGDILDKRRWSHLML